jgi:hypothetical protein
LQVQFLLNTSKIHLDAPRIASTSSLPRAEKTLLAIAMLHNKCIAVFIAKTNRAKIDVVVFARLILLRISCARIIARSTQRPSSTYRFRSRPSICLRGTSLIQNTTRLDSASQNPWSSCPWLACGAGLSQRVASNYMAIGCDACANRLQTFWPRLFDTAQRVERAICRAAPSCVFTTTIAPFFAMQRCRARSNRLRVAARTIRHATRSHRQQSAE